MGPKPDKGIQKYSPLWAVVGQTIIEESQEGVDLVVIGFGQQFVEQQDYLGRGKAESSPVGDGTHHLEIENIVWVEELIAGEHIHKFLLNGEL